MESKEENCLSLWESVPQQEEVKFNKSKKRLRKIRHKKLSSPDSDASEKEFGTRNMNDFINLHENDKNDDMVIFHNLSNILKKGPGKEVKINSFGSEEISSTDSIEITSSVNIFETPDIRPTICLNSTEEFCKTLDSNGNRDDNRIFEFEQIKKKEEILKDPCKIEKLTILNNEPEIGTGLSGALKFALNKGYLEKETCNIPISTTTSRIAHLQAYNYLIENKSDDNEFAAKTAFKEKDFKPNVKLNYIDDDGHVLNAKEAFRYLSYKFHGKGPGKNKIKKKRKKIKQERLIKQMSSSDTPLGTVDLLQQKQKETQSPFIILGGRNKPNF